jgi:MoaA/NifB/PqqE/SkfB family radical SAM enzyme
MHKCILPWISLETTPLGGVRPCCLYKGELPGINLRTHTLEEAFNSKAMQGLRETFEQGKQPGQCERCWIEEKAGKKSKREYMLEKFKHVPFEPNLIFLDLKLGNICNLKCRICGEWSSSKWAQEKVAQFGDKHIAKQWLKDGQWPRRSQGFWDNLDSLLPNLKYFEFTGGEPFLIKQHFDLLQRAVDQGHAGDIDIHYNTNGTQFPKQHEVWRHFKHVQIAFSIDNTGKRFEYERDGAKWRTVNTNIKRFIKMRDEGYPFSLQLCITWNLQNTYYMADILKWAKTSGIDDIHFNLMHDPEEYSLLNLPRSAHAEFMHRLDKAIVMHGDYADQIRSIKAITLKQPVIDPENIFAKIRETDSFRGVSFADTHPEVARLIGYEA